MIISEDDLAYLLILAYLVVGGEPDLMVIETEEGTKFKVISQCECDECEKQRTYKEESDNPIAAVKYYVDTMLMSKKNSTRLH